jgi:uncharacterized protein YqeY
LSILETLQARVNDSLKAGRKQDVRVLRMFVSELQRAAKDSGHVLDEDEELKVLHKERKRRLESIEAFEAGGRDDLVAEEEFAVALVEGFLPRQLDEAALTALVDRCIAETGASSPKDMGTVMSRLMQEAGSQVDGKTASRIVRERLSG